MGVRHVTQLAIGSWRAEVLYSLADLNIFAELSGGSRTPEELAAVCDLDARATTALLDAAVALRLLHKANGQYENAPVAERLLVGGQENSLLEWVRMMKSWSRRWADLTTVIQTGRPSGGRDSRVDLDHQEILDFQIGLHRYAMRTADEVADCVSGPISGMMLDLGGGCGAYSMALCRRFPELQSEIWERPEARPVANQVLVENGFTERISVRVADYSTGNYGSGRELILMSNIAHQESRDVFRKMLEGALEALVSGGKVVIHNNLLDEDRTKPQFAALHNLSAAVLWEHGRDFTRAELAALVEAAGFGTPSVHPIANGTSHVLIAAK